MHLVCPTCQSDRYAEFHKSERSVSGFQVYCRRCEEGCVDAIDVEKSMPSVSAPEWRELQVGERVKKGDEGRWPDGERIEVPPHFYGKEVKMPGIYFRLVTKS